MRFLLRRRGTGLPDWASDERSVGELYRGGYTLAQWHIVPVAQSIMLGALALGSVLAGAWLLLATLIVVLGPFAGSMIGVGFYVRRWQWSSVEVKDDDVLVCNPTGAHQFRLDALRVAESERGPELLPYRVRITDPGGLSVLCFGLGKRGNATWDASGTDDFLALVERRQAAGYGK